MTMHCGTCKKPVHYEKAGGRGVRFHSNGKRWCTYMRCGKSKPSVRKYINLFVFEITRKRVFDIICEDCSQALAEDAETVRRVTTWATSVGERLIDQAEEIAFLDPGDNSNWHDLKERK